MSTKDWHEVQEAASGVCLPFSQKSVVCLSYSYPTFLYIFPLSVFFFSLFQFSFSIFLYDWKPFFYILYVNNFTNVNGSLFFIFLALFLLSVTLYFCSPSLFLFSPLLSLSVSHSVNSLLCVSLIHLSMFAKRFKQILFVWRWTNLCADTFTDFRQWIPFYGDIHGTYIRW